MRGDRRLCHPTISWHLVRGRDKNRAHSRLRRGASAVDTERHDGYFVLVFPGRPFTSLALLCVLGTGNQPGCSEPAYRVTMGHQEIVDLPLQHARRDFHASSTFSLYFSLSLTFVSSSLFFLSVFFFTLNASFSRCPFAAPFDTIHRVCRLIFKS